MTEIFTSDRREDSGGQASRLHEMQCTERS